MADNCQLPPKPEVGRALVEIQSTAETLTLSDAFARLAEMVESLTRERAELLGRIAELQHLNEHLSAEDAHRRLEAERAAETYDESERSLRNRITALEREKADHVTELLAEVEDHRRAIEIVIESDKNPNPIIKWTADAAINTACVERAARADHAARHPEPGITPHDEGCTCQRCCGRANEANRIKNG